jgi:hypothetical protein
MKSICLVALLLAAACSDRAAFRPTNATARGHGGQPAASYDIRSSSDVDPHLRVNVWSRGASRDEGTTLVNLAMEVRNTGQRTVELEPDQLRLDVYTSSGTMLPRPQLVRVEPTTRSLMVPPGEAETIQLRFAMTVPVDPDDMATMRLRWALDQGDGQRYVQFTEFQRIPEQVATTSVIHYDPVFGFYDPFFYGPPYTHHHVQPVPVRRVIIQDRNRPERHVRRDR